MEDTRKKELFPFFAYLYSQQLDPDKYGQVASLDEWIKTIQSNEEDIAKITQAAEQLSDEDWDSIDQQYSEQVQDQSAQFAAKGAKLKKLKVTPKKCKCGCDMVTVKEKGGKISSKCSCGCGGSVKKGQVGMKAPKINTSVTKPASPILSDMDLTLARHEKGQVAQANSQIGETFSQAFARNRKAGMREFTYNGKRYTTQVAGSTKPTTKPAAPIKVSTPTTSPAPIAVIPKNNLPTSPPLDNRSYAPQGQFEGKERTGYVYPHTPPMKVVSWWAGYPRYSKSQKKFPTLWESKPFSLLRKEGGILTKQADGPVKPTTPTKAKVTPKVTPKPSATVDNSPERKTAQKFKSEFYSKKGVKYDTQSGLPIAPMKAKGGLVKKQSGGDIAQPIGTTQKGGKVKDRIGKSKAVVIPASLKCGGKGKIKPKTKK